MNKIILIGNLTRDVESGSTQSGISYARFTLAVNRKVKGEVDYINIVAWRGLADTCKTYLAKGRKCCVSGSLNIRDYTAKDGTKKQAVEVVAEDIEFLPSSTATNSKPQEKKVDLDTMQVVDEELPF